MAGTERFTGGFLGSLLQDEIEALVAVGAVRRFRTGNFLFTEGDRSEHVAVIRSGRVKVASYTAEGRELLLAVRGPGDLLGELSALDAQPRSASVGAIEPVEAVMIPADRFRHFLEDHPRVALLLIEMLIWRLREADRKRVEFGAFDVTARVARHILELAERYGVAESDGVRIDLPLSQEELAGWTGSSREAVAKALRQLRERGWVETSRRSIVVRDTEALRRRAT